MESDPASHSQLPRPISSFIGREAELTTLHQMLSSGVRLITLVGPGGVGKTRLALEVCARAVESYPDGVVFVTLESIADVDSILPEIARGSSIDLNGNVSPLDDLIAALKKRHLLLCVDNWEHLIEASGQMAPLLAACPGLQMIATSREPLRLRGEHVVWVEPLQLPSPGSAAELETVTGAQAVQLFVERARAVRPGFDLGPNNAAAVLEICSLVDGLPLAIELAAALIRSFSPETLLARMKRSIGFTGRSGSFETLVGGPRDLPIRQQTLHETINGSYSLLDTDERRVFRRLAVFAGGCDLEAAKAVCQPNNTEATTLLNTLIA